MLKYIADPHTSLTQQLHEKLTQVPVKEENVAVFSGVDNTDILPLGGLVKHHLVIVQLHKALVGRHCIRPHLLTPLHR